MGSIQDLAHATACRGRDGRGARGFAPRDVTSVERQLTSTRQHQAESRKCSSTARSAARMGRAGLLCRRHLATERIRDSYAAQGHYPRRELVKVPSTRQTGQQGPHRERVGIPQCTGGQVMHGTRG